MGRDLWFDIRLVGNVSFVRSAASLYLDYNNCIYLDSAGFGAEFRGVCLFLCLLKGGGAENGDRGVC